MPRHDGAAGFRQGYAGGEVKIALGTPRRRSPFVPERHMRYAGQMRKPLFVAVLLTAPAVGQSAPTLTAVEIASVSSSAGMETIGADQVATHRRHAPGPVTVVVRESGIGGSRLTLIDGEARTLPSSTRPLCGAQLVAGACRPGEAIGGLEITYRIGRIAAGQTFVFRDRSAVGAGPALEARITFA